MKNFVAVLILASSPAFAQEQYGLNTFRQIPCDADLAGQTLIISRPPTTAELAASIADRGADAPALLLERDHLVCDGSVWSLVAIIPQYR